MDFGAESAYLQRAINEDAFRESKVAKTSSFGYGCMRGARGPFSPSQWMELEHQALIYKYITYNVPVPSYLLNPIKKAFLSAAACTAFPALTSNSLGWGGLQLGYCNTDPEPGRCRRTDGKKWRCSREAVVDQKYCERHMNRGRHRSRKPVEGHSGHSSTTKPSPVAPGGASNGRSAAGHHQFNNNLQPCYNNVGLYDEAKTAPKQHYTIQEPSRSEFGLVRYDTLLNDEESKSQHSLGRLMHDDWPKMDADLRPDRATHLSISIPTARSDYIPPASSPTHRKLTASPQELEMGLGVGNVGNEQTQAAANWVPISWGAPMGGPLGEALHTTSNGGGDCKNLKPLNLMDSWDNSPRIHSHRGGIGSLSNGFGGSSSPKAESRKGLDGAGRCIGFMGTEAVTNPSLPAL